MTSDTKILVVALVFGLCGFFAGAVIVSTHYKVKIMAEELINIEGTAYRCVNLDGR
jgi:hypothetical protein